METQSIVAPHAARVEYIALPWLTKGEKWSGIVFKDGAAAHHLILLPDASTMKWQAGMDWAKEKGGDLPSRREQALLYSALPEEFEQDWYWSNGQRAGDPDYAWYQTFFNGTQNWYRKSFDLRVRAVRRVPIQPFVITEVSA